MNTASRQRVALTQKTFFGGKGQYVVQNHFDGICCTVSIKIKFCKEEKAQGDLSKVYKYLEGVKMEPVVPTNRTRSHRHKLKHRMLHI